VDAIEASGFSQEIGGRLVERKTERARLEAECNQIAELQKVHTPIVPQGGDEILGFGLDSDGCLGRATTARSDTFGVAPRFLIRDHDRKYGQAFARVATGCRIEILKRSYRMPEANAICERFLGSIRREYLDHMLVLGEIHLHRVVTEYVKYFNRARPHQRLEQKIPEGNSSAGKDERKGKIIAFSILNGLHPINQRAV